MKKVGESLLFVLARLLILTGEGDKELVREPVKNLSPRSEWLPMRRLTNAGRFLFVSFYNKLKIEPRLDFLK